MEPLLVAAQVAEILAIDECTVYRWTKRGLIPSVIMVREIRFRPEDIRAIRDNGLQPGAGDCDIKAVRERPRRTVKRTRLKVYPWERQESIAG